MNSVSLDEIKQLAQEFTTNKKDWHFHLLTPDCLLNTETKFTLVLEDCSDAKSYSYFSEEKPMETSKMLLELLHGSQIFEDKQEEKTEISEAVETMMKRAAELNTEGFFWHHHVLFPSCIYNTHAGKWTIVFEDPEKKTKMESVSDTEPKVDMKQIEPAFYHQNINK